MSAAGVAALEACWSSGTSADHLCDNPFFSTNPVSAAYRLSPLAEPIRPEMTGHVPGLDPGKGPAQDAPAAVETFCSHPAWTLSVPHPLSPPNKGPGSDLTEPVAAAAILLGFSQLSTSDETHLHVPPLKGGMPQPLPAPLPAAPPSERSIRLLPPAKEEKDRLMQDKEEEEETDREVEFLTSSDTEHLLGRSSPSAFRPSVQERRSFRGCGQVNYAYFEATLGPPEEADTCPLPVPPLPPPQQLHRRLRRSHSGPAGSFHKPAAVARVSNQFHQVSPMSDDDAKPEVPPRAPIPARGLKPDYRRWSAEVASGAYSDEDKPPKVPPREPLFRGDSRTPSPKSLPSYLHGVMPPTQSFAPDPKYVSAKALQRQQSEGATSRGPCILPIIENGRKVSSTHYYLLPERPPYLDRYEKLFRESKEADPTGAIEPGGEGRPWRGREADLATLAPKLRAELGAPIKRKHFPCVVSP